MPSQQADILALFTLPAEWSNSDWKMLQNLLWKHKDIFSSHKMDLSRAAMFTTLDIAIVYWNIPLHDQSRPKTAF